jgi:hypothetical protein
MFTPVLQVLNCHLHPMIYGKAVFRRVFPLVLLMLFCQSFRLFSQATQLNLKKEFPLLKIGNDVWIGTPGGLYQYKSMDDSYKLYSIPGKEGNEIRYLYYDNEWLWCVLDTGMAVLQTRLNQWMVFDKESGLPSNKINGIAFDGDYVWAATDNGAARFDRLIEEWEWYGTEKGIPDSNLVKILVYDKFVWFVTEKGFSEYDPQFEKWRHFTIPENEQIVISEAFEFGNNLWFLTNKGLIKFNPQLNSQEFFFNTAINSDHLVNMLYEDDAIWALSRNKIYTIQSESQVLKEFEGNYYIADYSLGNFNLDANEIWLSTDKNILQWNRLSKTWKIIDYASGISDSVYTNLYVSGGMTLLVNDVIIDYKLNTEGPWKTYKLIVSTGSGRTGSRNFFRNLFDNEEGGYIALGRNALRLDGTRATYVYTKNFDGKVTSGERLDIKGQLTLGENHTVYGFYNNIDYSETMYGLRYKSTAPKEPVREVNLGDFRRETGAVPFGENASIYGGNIWLQAGKKTERFKRSLISAKVLTGQLRSQKEFEYFQGATTEFNGKITDVSYLKNVFFAIPNLPASQIPEQPEIYLDDKNASNNSGNTQERTTIAGITGDFDLLIETEDYNFHTRFGALKLNTIILPGSSLVIRYKLNNQVVEEILQAGILSSSRQNIYSLNGALIIPNSLSIEIADSMNHKQNLYDYGIDADNDGQVDPEWIDFENGYLTFPGSNPFSEAIYDSLARSVYHIGVNFETRRALIKLNHKDLVRGTETVSLDGIMAVQGSDYVLDYTNGTLVFVKEGVVTIDTRIEIEYEYYPGTQNNTINSASVNFSPTDNFYIQADWLNFTKSTAPSNDSSANLLSLHSEFRKNFNERVDTRLITGIAYQAENNTLSGAFLEGLISTSKFRLQSRYANYEKSYSNLYEPQSLIGRTKNKLQLFTSADPLNFLRLTGEWKTEEAFAENSGKTPENRLGNYSVLFHKTNLPSWQISYQDINTLSDSVKTRKFFVTNQLEYQVPVDLLHHLPVKSLKVQAYLRQGKQSGLEILGTDNQRFNHKYIRVNSNFTDQIVGSLFYRRNDYFNDSDSVRRNLSSRNERVLISFSQEQWRVLQVNLSAENTLDQNPLNSSRFTSARINNFAQANFRFSPGQLWEKLKPLFFEFNINHSAISWGTTNKSTGHYLWQFYNNGKNLLDYSQKISNYYIKNEFRPTSKIILYSLFEWNNLDINNGASQLTQLYRRWNEKLELKLGYNLRIILQYKQYYQDRSHSRIYRYYEPSTWIEHRWNNSLQDILNVQYRISTDRENNLQSNSSNWIIGYNIIWRKEKILGLKRVEIRNEIAENITLTKGNSQKKNYLLTNNTSLDIYPFYAAIIRFQLQYRANNDLLFSANTYSDFAYNFKFILRF